jgi:hypothetical protein
MSVNHHVEYFQLADADTIETAYNICYDKRTAQLYAAELTYFYTHDAVPEWAIVLERVEQVGENFIFIQRDADLKD